MIEDVKVLKVARVKCQQELMFFTRYYFKQKSFRKFIVSEHHRIICEALEKVLRGETTRLIINIAPRYSKTELAVKNFIAHALAVNPSAKFIHLSHSDDLALDNSEEIKDIVSSAEYQQMFPEVQIKKDAKSKKKWYTTMGGGILAASASGQVTGFGAGKVDEEISEDDLDEFTAYDKEGFAGALIIDDPIKPDDAESDLKRERVNQRFESTIRNRVNSRKTPIIVIMQRIHTNDLCGYLQAIEPGVWTVVKLPSINPDGTALWPHKHTIEELKALRDINPYIFDTQYMQDPKPKEGLMYPTLKEYESIPLEKIEAIKSYTDTADEGIDFLCSIAYKVTRIGIFITDVIYTQKPMEFTETEVPIQLDKHEVQHADIESNNGGRGFARVVEKNLRMMGNTKTRIKWFHQSQNKEVRIFNASGQVANMIFFPKGWAQMWPQFYLSMTNYMKTGKNAHDDGPDVVTGIWEKNANYYLAKSKSKTNIDQVFY